MPKISIVFSRYSYLTPCMTFESRDKSINLQLAQAHSMQKSTANMLSRRCQNSRKSENTQVSELNSNLYLEICQKHDTSLQSRDISYFSAFYSIVLSFLFSRYLELAERHFSSDILVPFPDSGVLYSRGHTQLLNAAESKTAESKTLKSDIFVYFCKKLLIF